MFAEQAAESIERAIGLDPEDVAEWAKQNALELDAQAVRQQLYREPARPYAAQLDQIDPEALAAMAVDLASAERRAEGYQRAGPVMVELDGDKTDWAKRCAARMGRDLQSCPSGSHPMVHLDPANQGGPTG